MAVTSDLPYMILDADNHFTEPPDCYEKYIDPAKRDLAIRYVTGPDGKKVQLFAGRPSRFTSDQITFSKEELAKMLGDVPDEKDQLTTSPSGQAIPGMLLNRMNPLKGLS